MAKIGPVLQQVDGLGLSQEVGKQPHVEVADLFVPEMFEEHGQPVDEFTPLMT